jgi:hypothetical protein
LSFEGVALQSEYLNEEDIMYNRKPLHILLLVIMISLSCLICSCAHKTVKSETAPTNGVVTDWNNLIDEVEIVKPFSLDDYSRVVVAELETTTTPLPPAEENTYKPVKKVLASASDIFAKAIRDDFQEARSRVQVVGPVRYPLSIGAGPGALIVRGKLTKMDPGSQAKRYWVGFGAGKSLVEVAGEVSDGASNVPLLRFKHAKASGIGLFGGGYEKFLTDDLHDVGKDVGRMLLQFRGRPDVGQPQ